MKTAIINDRVKPELKGIPFDLKIPNDETIQAMKEARDNQNFTPLEISKLEALRK